MSITNQDEKVVYEEDDFDKFLSSLPRAKGWRIHHMYQFEGFWYHSLMLQGFLESQKHYKAQDSDILLATFPKCGTTWLKALIFAIVNRNKHSPLTQNHPLLVRNPHDLVPFLELELFFPNKTPDLSPLTDPRIIATHSPLGLLTKSVLKSKCKVVYLCRNPKDTFISYWHYSKKSKYPGYEGISSIEEGVDMFCKGLIPCGPVWDHVLDYWKASLENPEKVFFVTYEELQSEAIPLLRRLAEFMGCSFSKEEEDSGLVDAIVKLCSFQNLSKLEVNSDGSKVLINGIDSKAYFRRGEVGDWKNHLSVEMAARMDAVVEEKLQGSGLLELKPPTFSKSRA